MLWISPWNGFLRKEPVGADDLNALVNPDVDALMLRWLNDPEGSRSAASNTEWETFRAQSRQEFNLDPATDGPITAARRLGERGDEWRRIWQRFCQGPAAYPGIPEQLRSARPGGQGTLFEARDAWPQENE